MSELRFDDKVVIITGAGQGLGRSHALQLGARGAKVLINDLGGAATGGGKSSAAADAVVQEVKALGGDAAASYDSVEDGDKIVQAALDHFGRVDVVINNAGILRDTSFHKMSDEDWDLIYRVHVLGAYKVTHAAWPHLREQGGGRVLFTTSAAGLYGNFGQANYATAKLGLVGLTQSLALEGAKKGVHVNAIAPVAGSRLTATVLPEDLLDALKPEYVSPLAAWLCHDTCDENGGVFEVGGGFCARMRWERSAGKTWRVGRHITPESVRGAWKEITSFDETTHPTDVMASMQPLFANVQAGPSQGGNELLDVDEALAAELPEVTTSYDERDVSLYALGVGAAKDPGDDNELRYVYELHSDGQLVLPTFGVIPAINVMLGLAKEGYQAPGQHYGFDRILHGEQYTELKRPLPPKATLTHKGRVVDVVDKGKNALVTTETRSFDEHGEELIVNRFTAVVRGAGGFGGERKEREAPRNLPPERAPDAVVAERIDEHAALLYRLSGDWNPLHADPGMAMAFGFERPILHGLCTYGHAARHVLAHFADGDPRTFKSIEVRFADPVYPGETLVTEMWKEADLRVVFRCRVKERDVDVITRAAVELYDEIPQPQPRAEPAVAEPAASAESAGPSAADVFAGIAAHVSAHPELAERIGTVFQFRLKEPDSVWTLDLKNGGGAVEAGETQKADCTLALSNADFLEMTFGGADPQQLYFGGKLKISGNVMASQKLQFLQELDRSAIPTGGGASPATAAGPAADTPADDASASSGAPRAGEVMAALRERLAVDAAAGESVDARVHVVVTEPESVWTLDLKGARTVTEGADERSDVTLTLAEPALFGLARGEGTLADLFQRGEVRVDGDVAAARKLVFLERLF